MKRCIFRTQLIRGSEDNALTNMKSEKNVKRFVEEGKLMTIAAYRWNKNVFLYYECIQDDIMPQEIFQTLDEFLENWPGQNEYRKWIPMIDVFHFNEPANYDHWKRKVPVETRVGRVAHLKPEMISSYIYYHYQLQEERAFLGGKYEIIGIHENLLFHYKELPSIEEEPVAPKKLNTTGTPENWNDSRMDLHFKPWEDGYLYFKNIEPIVTCALS